MIPALLGNGIGCDELKKRADGLSYGGSDPVPAECREISLNLGGNTDKTIRPEHTDAQGFLLHRQPAYSEQPELKREVRPLRKEGEHQYTRRVLKKRRQGN